MKHQFAFIVDKGIDQAALIAGLNGNDPDFTMNIWDVALKGESAEAEEGQAIVEADLASPMSADDLHEALCLWIHEGDERPQFVAMK